MGVGGVQVTYIMYISKFRHCVKVKKNQYIWLKTKKTTKTIAGFLDIIINEYKRRDTNSK